jgi:hypothetical protein
MDIVVPLSPQLDIGLKLDETRDHGNPVEVR